MPDGAARARCGRCQRPRSHCLCALIPQLQSRTRVLILQHPEESRHALNTARLAALGVRGLYVPSRAVPAIDTDLRALVVLKHVVATCGYVLKRQRAVPTWRGSVCVRCSSGSSWRQPAPAASQSSPDQAGVA